MAYLQSDREQFRAAIDLAYEQTGVMVQAIEKRLLCYDVAAAFGAEDAVYRF